MVLPEIKITPPGVGIIVPGWKNQPPRRSNQTPEGPGNPMPLLVSQFRGYPQHITTATPHTTPNIDNYQGIPQHMKRRIPTNLPPGVNPGSYIDEWPNPHGIKTVGYQDITGSTGYPRQIITMSIPGPQPIKQIGYGIEQPWQEGIRQHTTIPITQIVPPGVYPDTYSRKKKMSYDGASTFLIGGILGFTLGAIIFTATGRKVAGEVTTAASRRVSSYIQPKG
jgi:hypothetical protein